jgi:hypothetical protein
MHALGCSETSGFTGTTLHNIPEDCILHSHRSEHQKSYNICYSCYILRMLSSGMWWRRVVLVTDILLQGTLFPVRSEVHSRCQPRGHVFVHTEVGDMFLRNVFPYKNNTASSNPRRQHPSLLEPWHQILHSPNVVNTLQARIIRTYPMSWWNKSCQQHLTISLNGHNSRVRTADCSVPPPASEYDYEYAEEDTVHANFNKPNRSQLGK